MSSRVDELFERLAALEREIETELNQARAHWRYRIEAGRVRFEHDVRQAHRKLKQNVFRFLRESNFTSLIPAPVIYSLIVPIGLLDLWVTVYQSICFRVYGIALVKRSAYIVLDRQHLAYLNWIEKINCVYCGYSNGVFAYVRE